MTSTKLISLDTGENDCSKMFTTSKTLCLRAWYDMCFRENNNYGSKRAYTVTIILRILLKSYSTLNLLNK